MTHVTCRLTTKNRDQLRNPALGNRVWATFTFFSFGYMLANRQTYRETDRRTYHKTPLPLVAYQERSRTRCLASVCVCVCVCVTVMSTADFHVNYNSAKCAAPAAASVTTFVYQLNQSILLSAASRLAAESDAGGEAGPQRRSATPHDGAGGRGGGGPQRRSATPHDGAGGALPHSPFDLSPNLSDLPV